VRTASRVAKNSPRTALHGLAHGLPKLQGQRPIFAALCAGNSRSPLASQILDAVLDRSPKSKARKSPLSASAKKPRRANILWCAWALAAVSDDSLAILSLSPASSGASEVKSLSPIFSTHGSRMIVAVHSISNERGTGLPVQAVCGHVVERLGDRHDAFFTRTR
jgi:hypothetical protein